MIWSKKTPTSSAEIDERDDQTIFINQEPWLEDGTSQTPSPVVEVNQPQVKTAKYKNFMLLGGGFLVLFLVMIFVLLIFKGRDTLPEEITVTPIPSSKPSSTDPFAVRFQQLRTDLKAADPGKRELPFPPVNNSLELQLDSKKN